jgi:hypothetical protein
MAESNHCGRCIGTNLEAVETVVSLNVLEIVRQQRAKRLAEGALQVASAYCSTAQCLLRRVNPQVLRNGEPSTLAGRGRAVGGDVVAHADDVMVDGRDLRYRVR